MKRFLVILVVLLLCRHAASPAEAEKRIRFDAKVNGQPVRFIFDTGASSPITLLSPAAHRLGLKVVPANYRPDPGHVACGKTETCNLDLGTTNIRISLNVFELPDYLYRAKEMDGVLGWPLLEEHIFAIDAISDTLVFYDHVPPKTAGWIKFQVQTNSGILALELQGEKRAKAIVVVDTGHDGGIIVHPKKWQTWKQTHTNLPITLDASYMPGAGLVVKEESFAHEIALGSLVITDVPVSEANQAQIATDPNFEVSLGLAALKRLEIIIDGEQKVAYLHPRSTPASPYPHNRLGAVFVPRNLQEDDLVAEVIDGSPASTAGIRNGDNLLKIGNLDVTRWRTDPNVLPLSRFWDSPAGTKLELTLKRGDNTFITTATLRNILAPAAPKD